MNAALDHNFKTEIFEIKDGEKSETDMVNTDISIDPVNLEFNVNYVGPDEDGGDKWIASKMDRKRYSEFLHEHDFSVVLDLPIIYPTSQNLLVDTVKETPPFNFQSFQESEMLKKIVTPIATTWCSDEKACKLYRSSEISKLAYEVEQILESDPEKGIAKYMNENEDVEELIENYGEHVPNTDNYKSLSLMMEIADWNRDLSPILKKNRRENLSSIDYGERAIRHIREADYCFELDLFLPALASYIHGIEWTIIAYLQKEVGRDVIDEEKKGGHYNEYLDLVNELEDKADLDQMTMARLEALNEMRRWMAHHKSGEINEIDLRNVRARLNEILEYLFD